MMSNYIFNHQFCCLAKYYINLNANTYHYYIILVAGGSMSPATKNFRLICVLLLHGNEH